MTNGQIFFVCFGGARARRFDFMVRYCPPLWRAGFADRWQSRRPPKHDILFAVLNGESACEGAGVNGAAT